MASDRENAGASQPGHNSLRTLTRGGLPCRGTGGKGASSGLRANLWRLDVAFSYDGGKSNTWLMGGSVKTFDKSSLEGRRRVGAILSDLTEETGLPALGAGADSLL